MKDSIFAKGWIRRDSPIGIYNCMYQGNMVFYVSPDSSLVDGLCRTQRNTMNSVAVADVVPAFAGGGEEFADGFLVVPFQWADAQVDELEGAVESYE